MSSCVMDIMDPAQDLEAAGAFEVIADLGATKTLNNGNKTEWAEGDAITLLSMTTGETLDWGKREEADAWVCHGKFDLINKSQGVFSGDLGGNCHRQGTDGCGRLQYVKAFGRL